MTLWELFGITVAVVVLGSYLVMLARVFIDIFADHAMVGWAKALWVVLLLLMPVIGVLIYLVARGDGIGRRRDQRAGLLG